MTIQRNQRRQRGDIAKANGAVSRVGCRPASVGAFSKHVGAARLNDRVTDKTQEFYQRLRAASPRQRRLHALHELKVARITETVRSLMGGLMLALIFILFSFL